MMSIKVMMRATRFDISEESGINNYRIFLNPVNSLTNPGFICDDDQGASGPEYQVLIKTGNFCNLLDFLPPNT